LPRADQTARTGHVVPWWAPQMTGAELALVEEVLASNYLNDGEVTERFEREIARLLGVRHAVAVTSGTSAIFLSLAALGVGPGDEVIVPDVTFIATANAVSLTGARPVLVDIDPRSLNISPEAFERAITARTKAVVPVHVSGRGNNLPQVLEIARSRGLFVVEDAAEAFMSSIAGGYLGTFGDTGCFSFSPNKTITTGQGGIIVTNDDRLHVRLRELKDQGRPVRGTGGDDLHHSIGYNFKLTNLQAAVGIGQLTELGSRLQRQRDIHLGYLEGLAEVPGLRFPGFQLAQGETPQWTDVLVDRRDELDGYLAARGVQCRRFWHPVHTQAPYQLEDSDFPNSTAVAPHALWLPSAFTLTDEVVSEVSRLIRDFLVP